jgi:hypothetical protein
MAGALVSEYQQKIETYLSSLPIDWSLIGQYVPSIGPFKRPHFQLYEYAIIAALFIIIFIHGCIVRRRKIHALKLKNQPKDFLKGIT